MQNRLSKPPATTAYGRLARWVLRHKPATLAIMAITVLVCTVLGIPPDVDPNLLALLPKKDPAAIALRELHAAEGGVNLVTLALADDQPDDGRPMPELLDEMAAELQALDDVEFAIHELDEDLATHLGLLQLEAGDIKELNNRLDGALLLGAATNPFVTAKLMEMGETTDRIGEASKMAAVQNSDGIGRVLLKPTGSSHDSRFAVKLMDQLETYLETKLAEEPGVRVLWMGGAYRHNVEDQRGIKQDILWTSAASVTLVLGILIISFRGIRAPLLIFLPLVAANLINLGLVWVFLGSLNTYTSFGTAILVGLGIDFAVHLVLRYREYRHAGQELEQAVVSAWDRTGPPCMVAALTSAAGFLALAAAQFQGFAQIGVLLAMGLMVCLCCMLVLLPLLISALDANPPAPVQSEKAEVPAPSNYSLAPPLLMVMVLATCLAGAMKLPDLEWEFDFSNLRRDGLAYTELSDDERKLARESYSPVVVTFKTAKRLEGATRRVRESIEAGELPHINRGVSLLDALPSDQADRSEQLAALVAKLDHPNLRYLPPPIVKQLMPLKGRTIEPLTRDDLPQAVLELLGASKPDTHRLLLFPQGNMWDLREAAKLGDELSAVIKRPAAGEYVALGALYRTIQRDMPIVGVLALVMVTLLTLIDVKKPVLAAAGIGTLLAGMVWAGAAVQSFGVKLSLLNVVGVPILLGIGVDVVIHLLHRLREEGPGGVRRAMRTTGFAASISTLTTVLSFASLTLAGNRGVRSLGLLVVIGLASVFLAAIVFLPLAWAAGWKVSGQAPEDQES